MCKHRCRNNENDNRTGNTRNYKINKNDISVIYNFQKRE